MALSIFKNRGIKAAQQLAKADYIKVASLPEEDRGARAIRLRMATAAKRIWIKHLLRVPKEPPFSKNNLLPP